VIEDIWSVVWVSLLAGIGITAAYSFVVVGWGRSAEARRAGAVGAALAYAALAVLFLAIFAAGVVLAVKIMLTKA
jgi:hypothetical protein